MDDYREYCERPVRKKDSVTLNSYDTPWSHIKESDDSEDEEMLPTEVFWPSNDGQPVRQRKVYFRDVDTGPQMTEGTHGVGPTGDRWDGQRILHTWYMLCKMDEHPTLGPRDWLGVDRWTGYREIRYRNSCTISSIPSGEVVIRREPLFKAPGR